MEQPSSPVDWASVSEDEVDDVDRTQPPTWLSDDAVTAAVASPSQTPALPREDPEAEADYTRDNNAALRELGMEPSSADASEEERHATSRKKAHARKLKETKAARRASNTRRQVGYLHPKPDNDRRIPAATPEQRERARRPADAPILGQRAGQLPIQGPGGPIPGAQPGLVPIPPAVAQHLLPGPVAAPPPVAPPNRADDGAGVNRGVPVRVTDVEYQAILPELLGVPHYRLPHETHAHRMAAAARNADYYRLLQLANRHGPKVVLIKNKRRTWARPQPAWVTMPIYDLKDAMRRNTIDRPEELDGTCMCKLPQTCPGCSRGDAYVLADSLYYVSPREIVTLLEQRGTTGRPAAVYGSIYRHLNHRGGFYDAGEGPEITYKRAGSRVMFYNRSQAPDYAHDAADWIRDHRAFVDTDHGPMGLAWDPVSTTPTRVIYRFCLVPAELVETLPLDQGLITSNYYGSVDVRRLTTEAAGAPPTTSSEDLHIAEIYSLGNALDVSETSTSTPVYVPKDMVAAIAIFAAGHPRNAATVASCYQHLRQIRRRWNLQPSEFEQAMPIAVRIGLLCNLENELNTLRAIQAAGEQIEDHRVLTLNPVSNLPWPLNIVSRLHYLKHKIEVSYFRPIAAYLSNWYPLLWKSAMGTLAMGALAVYFYGKRSGMSGFPLPSAPMQSASFLSNLWAWLKSFFARTSYAPPPSVCVAEMFPDEPVPPQKRGSSVVVGDTDIEDCRPTFGPYPTGLGVAYSRPRIFRSCHHNQLAAVLGRVTRETLESDPTIWHELYQCHVRNCEVEEIEPTPLTEWLARYPTAQRKKYDEAVRRMSSVENAKSTGTTAFVKLENNNKERDGELHYATPRLIQPQSPEYNATTGPFMHALGEHLKNGYTYSCFKYAAGWTAEQLDVWYNSMINYIPDPVFVRIDVVKLDASQDKDCVAHKWDIYIYHGAPDYAMDMLRHNARTWGCTRSGVKFSVPGTLGSGRPETTVGNTFLTVDACNLAARFAGITNRQVAGVVSGDDASAIISAPVADQFVTAVTDVFRRMGMALTIDRDEHPATFDFCGGRWWPAKTTGSHVIHYRFGPKPGRLLPKVFHCVYRSALGKRPQAYARQVALGLFDSVQHVPILRAAINQVLILTGGIPEKGAELEMFKYKTYVRHDAPVAAYDESSEWMTELYGLTNNDLHEMEAEIRAVRSLPHYLEHPGWKLVVDTDVPLNIFETLRRATAGLASQAREAVVAAFRWVRSFLGTSRAASAWNQILRGVYTATAIPAIAVARLFQLIFRVVDLLPPTYTLAILYNQVCALAAESTPPLFRYALSLGVAASTHAAGALNNPQLEWWCMLGNLLEGNPAALLYFCAVWLLPRGLQIGASSFAVASMPNSLSSVVFTAYSEEKWKKTTPGHPLLSAFSLAFIETLGYSLTIGAEAYSTAASRLVLHVLCSVLPLPAATVLHAGFNTFVYLARSTRPAQLAGICKTLAPLLFPVLPALAAIATRPTSMSNVRRAEQVLAKFERAGLSPEGKKFLTFACDPFHDTPVKLEGYPGPAVGDVAVQLVKQSLQVNRPSTVADTDNWDCHFWLDPSLIQHSGVSYQINHYGSLLNIDASTNKNWGSAMGGINVVRALSGESTALDISLVQATGGTKLVSSLPLPVEYCKGPYRVIAMGFEVHNTTAPLYKQGWVSVYRQSRNTQLSEGAIAVTDTAGASISEYPTNWFSPPPATADQAARYPGAKTWEAKEGSYITCSQGSDDIPVQRMTEVPFLLGDYDGIYALGTGGAAGQALGPAISKVSAGGASYYRPERIAPHSFNGCGAYFSGLSPETTLTLKVNIYIERYPTPLLPDLITMAQPQPAYDPVAIELYNRVLNDMPVGVMVKENGLGTWFAEAISTIAPAIAGGLSAIPHPLAQAASMAANTAGKVADRYLANDTVDEQARKARRRAARQRASNAAQRKRQPRQQQTQPKQQTPSQQRQRSRNIRASA